MTFAVEYDEVVPPHETPRFIFSGFNDDPDTGDVVDVERTTTTEDGVTTSVYVYTLKFAQGGTHVAGTDAVFTVMYVGDPTIVDSITIPIVAGQ